ncbi:MAG: DUF1786 domain-containing protein [bacterium]|nr:DUF1786 domain-containing protein [bacterium]
MKCSCQIKELDTEDTVLAIDVGGGTQDILIYNPCQEMENCFKLIMPSQTVIISKKIRKATHTKKNIFLYGYLMGGGPSTKAIKDHLRAGLRVMAKEEAAKSIHDNLEKVNSMGVAVTDAFSGESEAIEMKDVDLTILSEVLRGFSLSLPRKFIIAVQDHGECKEGSNRDFRFSLIKKFIQDNGYINHLIYKEIPLEFTRMKSIQKYIPQAILMDTGFAAVWGAICDHLVEREKERGVVILNIGNQHTLGVLLKKDKIWGVFEEHTRNMDSEKLKSLIHKFVNGNLSHQEVFSAGGHGCFINSLYQRNKGYELVTVTGPKREIAKNMGYYFANPYGDMMLTGCYGLIRAAKENRFI